MLNISKISKAFLIAGIVFAVSATTPSLVVAKTCAEAQQALRQATNDADKKYSKAEKKYDQAIKNFNKKVAEAKEKCAEINQELSECSAYLAVESLKEMAEDELSVARKARENNSAIINAQKAVKEACDNKIIDENKEYTGTSKLSEQEQKNIVAAQKAEQEKNKADEAVAQSKTVLQEKQKAMEEACATNANSDACQKAMQEYRLSTEQYNQSTQTAKEKSESYAKTSKTTQEAQTKAVNKVNKAQEDVDKFCDKGGKKYNVKKCNEANQALANAKANTNYQNYLNSQPQADSQATGNLSKQGKQISEDPSKVLLEYNKLHSQADEARAKSEQAKNKMDGAKAELDAASEAVDLACVKKNSKECKAAKAEYNSKSQAYQSAQKDYNYLNNDYNNKQQQLNQASDIINDCKDSTDPKCKGEYNGVYLDAKKFDARREIKASEQKVADAEKSVNQAQKQKEQADKNYNQVVAKVAAACENAESAECKAAKNALSKAEETRIQAQKNIETAQLSLASAQKDNENAVRASNNLDNDIEVGKAQKTMEAACKADNGKITDIEGCIAATKDHKEKVKKAACEKDASSNDCLMAQMDLDTYDDQADFERAAADTNRQMKASTVVDSAKMMLNEVQKICAASGASSPQCQEAKDKLQAYLEANIDACPDEACRLAIRYGRAVAEGHKAQDTTNMRAITNLLTDKTGANSLAGYRSEFFNYEASGDVLESVTRRAALAVVTFKPIAYVFACFGLVGFAWMAIFNKISWKWFSHIAMGLFLVANMGRFIEYFVIGDGAEQHYYIGAWADGAKASKDSSRMLANSFKDAFYSYGDVINTNKGIEKFASDGGALSESETPLGTGEESEGGLLSSVLGLGGEKDIRKFCQKTEGASGWSNFTDCMKDVVSTVKKGANTVKIVTSTIQNTKQNVTDVKNFSKGIGEAFKNIGSADSLSDILNNTSRILNNASSILSTTTGAVGGIAGATGGVANDFQDMGKSREEQQQLANERIDGATNKTNEWIDQQQDTGILGAIDDIENKGSELVDITNEGLNGAETIVSTAEDVYDKLSGSENDKEENKKDDNKQDTGSDTETGDADTETGGADTEAGDTDTEGSKEPTQEEITQAYYDANTKANDLRNQKASQERELERLKNQLSDTESNVELYCGNGNEDSALCAAAKAERDAIKGSIAITEYQLSETSKQYEEADKAAKEAHEKKLQSDIDASEQKMIGAQKGYEAACNKEAANYSQTECFIATRKYMSAASEYTKSVETKAKNDGTYIEKPTGEVPQEKGVTEQYKESKSTTSDAKNNLDQIERDIETTKKNLEEAKANVAKSCSVDANSQACISAKSIVSTLEAKKNNLESAVDGAKAEYEAAKEAEKDAYKNKLEDDLSNAQAMVTVAQAAADEACKSGENYNYDECNKAIDQLINTQANLAKTIAEKDKFEGTYIEETTPEPSVPQEKGVTEQYNDARSATTSAESNLAQITRDIETTEKNLKEAEANAARSCSVDANSQACISARNIVSTLEAKKNNLESAISGAQAEVDAAKQAETAAYQNKIEADVSNAQAEVGAAQAEVDAACKSGENYNYNVCNNAMNKLINAQANLAKTIAEKDKFEGTYIDQASYDKKQEDLRNAENSMYQTGDNGESTQNPTEAYEDLQSTVNSLYNQIGSQEKEIERLEKDAANKEKRAKEECAKNENSNACASAKKEVEAAQDKINHKKQEHEETKKRYTEAHSKIESAYQSSLNSEVKGAEEAYNDAVAQREAASKELENANVELSNAQQGVASSRKDAEDAVSAAQAAKSEYEKALAEGKTGEELSKLKKDYEEKLLAMKAAQNKYEESKEYYKKQEQRVKKAKEDYSDSIDNVSRASENWAALTSEQDNQTGESKLFDAETSSNNSVVSSYERENSPAALANASQRSYEESKSALSRAKQDLEQKEKQAERAQKEYEAALKKAQNSNSDADIKEAERLKQKADLAKNEFNMAKTEHDTATADYASKEQDYCEKKIKSEQYKQKEYEEKIKVNESMLNTYKAEAEKRYAEATKAAERFKAAQAALQADDEAGKIEVAKLYEEYKKAKEEYNQYANLYNNTYSELSNTKKQYSDSLNTVKELENLLKKYL